MRTITGTAEPSRSFSGGDRLLTSDHVLVETWVLLRHRIHRRAAEQFWDGLKSGLALLEPVGTADLEAAWAIGQTFSAETARRAGDDE